ncbi:hypothetical protein ABK040_006425 [Willaertia magna]
MFSSSISSSSDIYLNKTYEETIEALNSCILPLNTSKTSNPQMTNIEATNYCIEQLGIPINKIPMIHIAGTKGKGSTCAFIESILRNNGLKTGLFTSPHLIDIRERVRINGIPISKTDFIKYFWECYEGLIEPKDTMFPSMATYFRFMLLIALKAFVDQKVDVAIMEVGIGGRFDATNVISPVVCGISSIGYDHMDMLGDTIEQIAWQKAGIMKRDIPCFTSAQKEEVLNTFITNSKEVGSKLYLCPSLDDCGKNITLGLLGEHQKLNASLALGVAYTFLQKTNRLTSNTIVDDKSIESIRDGLYKFPSFTLEESFRNGLKQCQWPGRCQILKFPGLTFYLDGAHTDESLDLCRKWFVDSLDSKSQNIQENGYIEVEESSDEEIEHLKKNFTIQRREDITNLANLKYGNLSSNNETNILVFNYTGVRDPRKLLVSLAKSKERFNYIVFCPTDSQKTSLLKPKTALSVEDQKKLNNLKQIWEELTGMNSDNILIIPSINQVLEWLWQMESKQVSVLVTGSIYLIGDFCRKLCKIQSTQK